MENVIQLAEEKSVIPTTATTVRRTFVIYAKSLGLEAPVERVVGKQTDHGNYVSEKFYNLLLESQVVKTMGPVLESHHGVIEKVKMSCLKILRDRIFRN